MRPQPQQMIQDAGDLIEHHPYILGAQRRLDPQQFLDGQYIAMLVTHHGDVVEAIHVADALIERLAFRQFLSAAMQKTDVGIGAFDHLAVQFQHQAQHTVGGGMLRPEIHGVVADLSHCRLPSDRALRLRSDCHGVSPGAPGPAARC